MNPFWTEIIIQTILKHKHKEKTTIKRNSVIPTLSLPKPIENL